MGRGSAALATSPIGPDRTRGYSPARYAVMRRKAAKQLAGHGRLFLLAPKNSLAGTMPPFAPKGTEKGSNAASVPGVPRARSRSNADHATARRRFKGCALGLRQSRPPSPPLSAPVPRPLFHRRFRRHRDSQSRRSRPRKETTNVPIHLSPLE